MKNFLKNILDNVKVYGKEAFKKQAYEYWILPTYLLCVVLGFTPLNLMMVLFFVFIYLGDSLQYMTNLHLLEIENKEYNLENVPPYTKDSFNLGKIFKRIGFLFFVLFLTTLTGMEILWSIGLAVVLTLSFLIILSLVFTGKVW